MQHRSIALAVSLALTGSALVGSALTESAHAAPAAPANQPPTGGLNDTSLEARLVGLGYTPKKLSKGYLIEVKKDTWTIPIQLVISSDMTKLGLNANLGTVDEASVTAAQWRDIMVANGTIDPSSFYLNGTNHQLYLHRVIDNRNVSPALLADQIGKFMDGLINTNATWSPVVK